MNKQKVKQPKTVQELNQILTPFKMHIEERETGYRIWENRGEATDFNSLESLVDSLTVPF